MLGEAHWLKTVTIIIFSIWWGNLKECGQNVNNDTWGWGEGMEFGETSLSIVFTMFQFYITVFSFLSKEGRKEERKDSVRNISSFPDLWSWCCALSFAKVRIRAGRCLHAKRFSWREVRYFHCCRFYSTTCSGSLLPSPFVTACSQQDMWYQ